MIFHRKLNRSLHEYLDDSHAKVIGIEPLFRSRVSGDEQNQSNENEQQQLIGALIVEQLKDDHVYDHMVDKTRTIASHGADGTFQRP